MILQSVKMALKSVMSNKLRSFLTMLGIIIGVTALVVVVSLVNGATGSINDSINSLGTNMMAVTIKDDHDKPIKLSELSDFTKEDFIEEAAPAAQTNATVTSDYSEETARIVGTTASYETIMGLSVGSGRFIMKPDVDNNSNIIVINSDLANDVIGRSNVVGEKIKLNGKSFLVAGVLEDTNSLNGNSSQSSSDSSDYVAYIPYTSLIRLTDSVSLDITSFYLSMTEDDMDEAEDKLEQVLLDRFSDDEDAYSIMNQSSIYEAMESVNQTLSLLLGGIAGISLLVGGIGIMNIMLVSVTERTREIGIRKAIGAGRGVILMQFLIEALVVSMMGCFIGIAVSWAVIGIIDIAGNVNYSLSIPVAMLSMGFSLAIGILFGLYPADKAAKKKAIEALRFGG